MPCDSAITLRTIACPISVAAGHFDGRARQLREGGHLELGRLDGIAEIAQLFRNLLDR